MTLSFNEQREEKPWSRGDRVCRKNDQLVSMFRGYKLGKVCRSKRLIRQSIR